MLISCSTFKLYVKKKSKYCGVGVPPALNIQFKCATAYQICLLRYCDYDLIVRDASQWPGFLMARSINTLDSFRSCAWGLEARFLRVLRTETRNIGRNRVSSVSVRKPPLAFLDRRSLKPLIFWWNILCLASVACFFRIAMKLLTNYQLLITNYQLPLKCIELYTFGISRHFAFLLP